MPPHPPGEPPRATTMVCESCEVTWRGTPDDECWSCSESGRVTTAAPAKVRQGVAAVERQRLVG